MYLEATESRPEVDLRFVDGKGFIRGMLREGFLDALFESITDHLDFEVGNHQGRQFLLDIEVKEFPTRALAPVLRMLDMLDAHRAEGANVQIAWHCPADSDLLRVRVSDLARRYPKLISMDERK
jgi:hypothetical protein